MDIGTALCLPLEWQSCFADFCDEAQEQVVEGALFHLLVILLEISLANTKLYPGRDEFYLFCPNVPSILIVPINSKAFILIGGWSTRCFTKSDEKWINNWSKRINDIFKKYNF